MKVQLRFKATETTKEVNRVYTVNNFFHFLRIWFKAKRERASAFLVFLE